MAEGWEISDTLSVVAVAVSVAGLAIAWQAALRGLLQQQMTTYLDAYQTALADGGIPGTVRDFDRLVEHQQRRIEILSGQLVGVIDLMEDTLDPRRHRWRTFLSGMPGAIDRYDGFKLEDYARHRRTKREIEAIRFRLAAATR